MGHFDGALANLTHVRDARNGRISSWDQNGKNHDYWLIPPNESVTLGEIFGPGCIKHIWMTSVGKALSLDLLRRKTIVAWRL